MEKMIGYCGIICSDCPVLMATQNNDDAERKRVAEIFTKQYGKGYKPEDINCDGCIGDNPRIFSYCNVCEIRKCGREKKLKTVHTALNIHVKSSLNCSVNIQRLKRS